MITSAQEWLCQHWQLDASASRQGSIDPLYSGWLLAPGGPVAAFDDPSVHVLACMTSAQSGKTVTAMGLLACATDQQPGPAMWVLPAGDEVQTFGETRLMPSILQCAPLARKLPAGRWATKTREIQWPFGPLLLVGANSGSKLSGKPIRYLFLDEEKDFGDPGAVSKAMKRVTSFRGSKVFRISTPKRPNETIHAAFLAGSQSEWRVRCPKCGHTAEATWQRMTWERDNPSADERRRSLRLRCANDACDHAWHDHADDRLRLASEGEWHVANAGHPRDTYSARWSRLIAPWAAWAPVLAEYETAAASLARGLQEPMAIWYQEALGLPYEQGMLEETDPLPEGPYLMSDPWAAGVRTLIGADVQKDRLEVVARTVAASGESRLRHEGIVATFDDLEALRRELQTDARWVMIDARYNTGEVLRACHRHGWTACVGDDLDAGYTHQIKGQTVRRAFSQAQRVDTGIGGARHGLYVWQFRWSNRLVKDTLALLSAGKASATPWTISRDASQSYRDQLRSEVLRTVYDRDTGQPRQKWVKRHRDRDNHRWDCECMVLVGMLAGGLLRADVDIAGEANPSTDLPGAPPGG